MKQIKFSHWYTKLDGVIDKDCNTAILLFVTSIDSRTLSDKLIEFDTKFFREDGNGFGYYDLPKGDVIFLLFKADVTEKLFCTIRRYTQQKHDYYNNLEGCKFEVIFPPPPPNNQEHQAPAGLSAP